MTPHPGWLVSSIGAGLVGVGLLTIVRSVLGLPFDPMLAAALFATCGGALIVDMYAGQSAGTWAGVLRPATEPETDEEEAETGVEPTLPYAEFGTPEYYYSRYRVVRLLDLTLKAKHPDPYLVPRYDALGCGAGWRESVLALLPSEMLDVGPAGTWLKGLTVYELLRELNQDHIELLPCPAPMRAEEMAGNGAEQREIGGVGGLGEA